jgi:hypothetical protein
LDFKSTHNFIKTAASARIGITLCSRVGLRVAMANGDRVTSSGRCKDLKFWDDDEPFMIDCYGLALGSYDMVLGV